MPSWRSIALVAGLLAACSSKGCSCVQPIKGGFPVSERRDNAIQVRATSSLFGFLSANGPAIIPKLLPMGSMFNVPPQCGGTANICCGTPAPMCRLSFDFRTVALTPTPPNLVHLTTDFVLTTLDNLPIVAGGVNCNVSIDTTRTGAQTMNVTTDLAFDVNATSNLTEVHANNATVTGIDAGDLKLDEPGSSFLCTIGNWDPIKNFIISQLETQVAKQISTTVDNQICMACMDKTDCPPYATDCKSGKCVAADGKTCFHEVGIDGRMNAGAGLAKYSPGLKAYMDVLAALGNYASADTGLSLGMLGGGRADPHSPCVPQAEPPVKETIPQSATFDTDQLPEAATPYHVGIGVHRNELDVMGFSAWDAGALCLSVGTPQVALLSSGTVGVVIPSLSELTHGDDVPMYIVMRPSKPPTFKLGKGTFQPGSRVIDDGLIHVSLPGLSIDFYAFIDERYVRIMTLNADVDVPVSLDIDAQGRIVPLLGDLKRAFSRLTVTNSKLLSDSPRDLALAFPTILGLALGQVAGGLPPIKLPQLMGLALTPIAITSTDPGATGEHQFLSIFANLAVAPMATLAAETTAELDGLSLPETRAFSVSGRTEGVEPRARLRLGGRAPGNAPLEWSWSLDDGAWSLWSPESDLILTHPVLWLQGRHHVDVRARAAGAPETADPTPARVELLVDTIAPEGRFDDAPDGSLLASVHDNVSQVVEYRFGVRGSYTIWSERARFVPPRGVLPEQVTVEARDEAGNVASLGFHGRTTNPPATGCGCRVGGATGANDWNGSALVLALLFAGGVLMRSRRRAGALALLAMLAGCNSNLGKGDFESPTDEIGRWSSVVAQKGQISVSAYDSTFGDLAYARFTVGQPPSWQIVDGVDLAAPPDKPGGYRRGVSDAGPDVGLYTSLSLTRSGEPRIAYYDKTARALKFARGPGRFRTHTVEAPSMTVDIGRFAALSLDANDVPAIAYMATGIADAGGAFHGELRLAVAKTPTPESAADWTITTIDRTRISCAGRCPMGQACIQAQMVGTMPNGDPSISTCQATQTSCAPACSGTQACIANACQAPLAAGKPALPDGTGLFTQALRAPSGALTLIYYDYAQGDLKIAAQAAPGGAFAVKFIDGNDPSTDVGQFAAAALADDGTVHVAYVDALADRLLYKRFAASADAAALMPEVIDDALRADGPHHVGAGASLILQSGSPVVVYQDQQTVELLEARRSGTTWTHQPLDTGFPGFGWWPHLVTDGGKTYVSQFVYDRQTRANSLTGTFQVAPLP